MEHFDPKHICNTSDDRGRYRYEAQPEICKWNCGVLADQLGLVINRADLEPGMEAFNAVYEDEYLRLMSEKLGLTAKDGQKKEDKMLVDTLFDVLTHTGADFTCMFRYLSKLNAFDIDSREHVLNQLVSASETLAQQKRKLDKESGGVSDAQYDMIMMLLKENPARARQYGITPSLVAQVKANREAKEALDATTDDERMESVRTAWVDWIDVYISRIKEEGDAASDGVRRCHMLKVNPLFVLRNHVAQKAIDLAHEGDYEGVQHIFELMAHPFDEPSDEKDLEFAQPQDPSMAPLFHADTNKNRNLRGETAVDEERVIKIPIVDDVIEYLNQQTLKYWLAHDRKPKEVWGLLRLDGLKGRAHLKPRHRYYREYLAKWNAKQAAKKAANNAAIPVTA
ncbi:Selenoprotein O [Phytophthora palmivora]|uniref:Selenoprotein O n=1 Tax=Phytophthora palmivora TaxID=4796 RepID=A0A2P4XQM2_9STRA|nr:Selenoprotein O [Phytophthora palmivora]